MGKALQARIEGDDPPSDKEIMKEIEGMNLESVGAGLGSGRYLSPEAIVEELTLIPKIPTKKLASLEKEWKDGIKDSLAVMSELTELHEKGLVPNGWIEKGVDN